MTDTVAIEQITTNGNVREDLGDLKGLIKSISVIGVVTPVTVRPGPDDTYQLVAGHRRLAAAKEAGLDRIPAMIDQAIQTDQEHKAVQVVENLHRKDLTGYEQARPFDELVDLGFKPTDVGQMVGLSGAKVNKQRSVLSLDEKVQKALHNDQLTLEAALEIGSKVDAADQGDVIDSMVGDGISLDRALYIITDKRDKEIAETTIANRLAEWEGDVCTYDKAGRAWRDLRSIEVDITDHRSQPCHVLITVTNNWGPPRLEEWCKKPNSHRLEGKSELKKARAEEDHAERTGDKDRAAAGRTAKGERFEAYEAIIHKARKKDAASLATAYLIDHHGADVKKDAAKMLGWDGPASDWDGRVKFIQGQLDTNLTGTLLALALAYSEQTFGYAWNKSMGDAVGAITLELGLDLPSTEEVMDRPPEAE